MDSFPASQRERKKNPLQEKRDILNQLAAYGVHIPDMSALEDAEFKFYADGSNTLLGQGKVKKSEMIKNVKGEDELKTFWRWVPEDHGPNGPKGELRISVESDRLVSIRPYTQVKSAKVWRGTLRNSTGEPVVGVVKFTLAPKNGEQEDGEAA